MKSYCKFPHSHAIQDAGVFFSSAEQNKILLAETRIIGESYVSQSLWESKNIYMQNKINTHGSWWYIEVLRHERIGMCKKLNITYNNFICNPQPRQTVLTVFATVWSRSFLSHYDACVGANSHVSWRCACLQLSTPNGSAVESTLILTRLAFDTMWQEAQAPDGLERAQDYLLNFFV